jgi:glycine cleavage system H protein
MSTTKFTPEHEWLRLEGDNLVTVGITDFAQEQLGDLVYIQLPEVGKRLGKGEEAAVIESVKTAGEISMPAGGVIVEVNANIVDDPAVVNQDALGAGWFFKMKIGAIDELNDLMDEAAYREFVNGLG